MVKKEYSKKIIIAGMILLFSSNFMYVYNKYTHIDKNIVEIPNYKANGGNLCNYNVENKKISFQINVLNVAIFRNNFILSNYIKILAHNINYQKNKLYKRIKFANLTISTEIKNLNNMKNIISIHPFNYLQKFQERNYYMPEKPPKVYQNKLTTTNNINILNCKIKLNSSGLNSIFYNSEEALIGIKSIGSLVSCSKLLIFSKDNFINKNIYYFSRNFNILKTYNKFVNIYNHDNRNNLISKNKFIKKLRPVRKNKFVYSRYYLSNKNSSGSNYINNKMYIGLSLFLSGAGIIIIILGRLTANKRRFKYTPKRKFNIFSSNEYFPLEIRKKKEHDSKSMDGILSKDEVKKPGIWYLREQTLSISDRNDILKRKPITKVVIDNEVPWIRGVNDDSASTSMHSLKETIENNNDDDTSYKLDEASDIFDMELNCSSNNKSIGEKLMITGTNEPLPFVIEGNNMPEGDNITMSTHTSTSESDINNEFLSLEPVLFINSYDKKTNLYTITHANLAYVDPLFNSFKSENNAEVLQNNEKISFLNKWLAFTDEEKAKYYKSLYLRRAKVRYVNETTFTAQTDSFIHQKILSSQLNWKKPNSKLIFSNVKKRIMQSKDPKLSVKEKNEALLNFDKITDFKSREEVGSRDSKLTTYGWFKKPRYYLSRNLTSESITKSDYIYIQDQYRQFCNMRLLLSDCVNSNQFFHVLLKEIDNKTNMSEIDSEMTQLDRFIVNEIMLDLRELINTYKIFVNIKHIDFRLLKTHIDETKKLRFPIYVKDYFEKSCVVKTVEDGPRIFGTSENDIFRLINEM